MKLLPLTLTLFDKVTNNTYKGTVLLKNLNNPGPAENVSNATGIDPNEAYDGKGAGLFIILVISVYALSIVLFIASFITKKSGVGESLNEESTVTTYLHKVGDLKEKTAREHFKKLKMSIISKVEADSQNQRRGRKGSKGAKDLASMSRTSSRSSLGDGKILTDRPKSTNGSETIPSTGLLPKDDDARQPLLGCDTPESATPQVRDTLSPNFEPWSGHGRSASPALRRTNSPRTLSIIKEQENEQDDSDGSRKRQGHNVLKRKAGGSVDNLRSKSLDTALGSHEVFSEEETTDDDDEEEEQDSECESPSNIAPETREGGPDNGFRDVPDSRTGSRDRHRKQDPVVSPPRFFTQRPNPHIERPRPKHSLPRPHSYEDVWEQMPQKIIPPPKQRSNRNPKNLYVHIPRGDLNSSDVWVLRNSNRRAVFVQERSPSPPQGDVIPNERQVIQNQALQHQRPGTLDTSKLQRERSLRDRSKRDVSPPDPRSMYLSPQENLNLPRPFRTPSPRSPTEQYLPRVGDPRAARDTMSPNRSYTSPQSPGGGRDKDKAVVKITLDRSPDHPGSHLSDQGWSNGGYDQSPRPSGHRSETERRERTPTKFSFTEGASKLDVPQSQFPVTFNSPGLPRRKEETL